MSFNVIQNHILQWNFNILLIYKTPLYLAVDKGNIEIIKLLLNNDKLDINFLNILNIFYIKFKWYLSIKFHNHIFKYNSKIIYINKIQKSYLLIGFKIISFNYILKNIFQ